MLLLRHCQLSSDDLITCERVMLRFVSGRAKAVDLDFNVWDFSLPELYGYILGMFVRLGLVECLGITCGELLDFIVDVDRGYMATFYHSFYHAADVTAMLFHMLNGIQARHYLTKPDMAALLLAGLCHDIGHPGLNNLYQVNACTDLVKEHGEASVLEKYSYTLAMELVTKHALFRNIANSPHSTLPEGNRATEESMRQSMIKAILATDMSFHYDILNNLNSLIEITTSPVTSPNASEAETETESDGSETDPDHSPPPSPTQLSLGTALDIKDTLPMDQPSASSNPASASTATSESSPSVAPSGAPAKGARFQCPVVTRRRQSSCSSQSSSGSTSSDGSSQEEGGLGTPQPGNLTPEWRQNLCNCLLHAADISNAVKPWTLCKRWSDLVVQEFFRQGDIEKAQGLPVSPNMDRNQHNQPQISLGFGDFVVQPYFESFVELLPEAAPFLTSLTSNRVQWLALQKSSQQFGNDPYFVVDPLEDPTLVERPNSPLQPPQLPTGRRVSVAAGVLILDDTRPQRAPPRRLRHSTNTEVSHGHLIRKMKRSLSGRSLSSSLHNLQTHSTLPRSSHSAEKMTVSHGDLLSLAAKQSSALLPKVVSPNSESKAAHAARTEAALLPPKAPSPLTNFPLAKSPGSDAPDPGDQGSQILADGAEAAYRTRRHASLQVDNAGQKGARQEYGDGYIIFNDRDRDFGRMWDQRDAGHIPSSFAEASSASQSTPLVQTGGLGSSPDTNSSSRRPSPSQASLAGNRQSTPAVMMRHAKNNGVQTTVGLFEPVGSRSGCGPLDGVQEIPVFKRTVEGSPLLALNKDGKVETRTGPWSEATVSEDGPIGLVVQSVAGVLDGSEEEKTDGTVAISAAVSVPGGVE